jgi:serine/threonine protein kinase
MNGTVAHRWIRRHGEDSGTDLHAVFHEARCLAMCSGHPSVVKTRDVIADYVRRDVFILMGFIGPSLQRLISPYFPFSEGVTHTCMCQLLRSVEKMHAAGVIHHDIKSDNIHIDNGGVLKIYDLGMSMSLHPMGWHT